MALQTPGPLTFRIDCNAFSHFEIGLFVHIHVAHALIMLDHGHSGVSDHRFD